MKTFCGLQNKLPKALLFNEVNHERFELSHCLVSSNGFGSFCFVLFWLVTVLLIIWPRSLVLCSFLN